MAEEAVPPRAAVATVADGAFFIHRSVTSTRPPISPASKKAIETERVLCLMVFHSTLVENAKEGGRKRVFSLFLPP
jgi:hypothetical protein